MRSWNWILGCLLVAGSVLGAGWLVASRERPAAIVPAPQVAVQTSPVAPQSLVSAQGELYYADGAGSFFHLEPGPAGLRVSRVQKLVYDPLRHRDAPQLRESHGYYLDDLGADFQRRRDALRSQLAAAPPAESCEQLAGSLMAIGDLEGLVAALDHQAYVVKRGVALVLGEAGYLVAGRALCDLLLEAGDTQRRAWRALKNLTGQDFVENIERVDQTRAAASYNDWFRSHPAAHPFQRVVPPDE